MLTDKIKALFQFIEFLYLNIDEFNKYNYLIDELNALYDKSNKLEPEKNYFEKKEFEKLQDEINQKRNHLLQNTIQKGIKKASELNIYNPKKYASIYNQNNDEAFNIINIVEDKDLPIILESKQKYIEFRTKTRNATLQQGELYDKLDLILKVVFNYFDKETENEFAKLPKCEQLIVIKGYQILKDRYKAYLEQKQASPPQQSEKSKPAQESPKTFEELFYDPDLVIPSINILKELEPPLIDTDYNYIGKLKGIICVWINELQRQGIIKHYSDRKIFASLIPQKIKRFSIDESMFGKHHTKAENNYRTDVKTKVSKIKLSQNSH